MCGNTCFPLRLACEGGAVLFLLEPRREHLTCAAYGSKSVRVGGYTSFPLRITKFHLVEDGGVRGVLGLVAPIPWTMESRTGGP